MSSEAQADNSTSVHGDQPTKSKQKPQWKRRVTLTGLILTSAFNIVMAPINALGGPREVLGLNDAQDVPVVSAPPTLFDTISEEALRVPTSYEMVPVFLRPVDYRWGDFGTGVERINLAIDAATRPDRRGIPLRFGRSIILDVPFTDEQLTQDHARSAEILSEYLKRHVSGPSNKKYMAFFPGHSRSRVAMTDDGMRDVGVAGFATGLDSQHSLVYTSWPFQLDESVKYTQTSPEILSLAEVIAHEGAHALGLGHTNNVDSIMHGDDESGIYHGTRNPDASFQRDEMELLYKSPFLSAEPFVDQLYIGYYDRLSNERKTLLGKPTSAMRPVYVGDKDSGELEGYLAEFENGFIGIAAPQPNPDGSKYWDAPGFQLIDDKAAWNKAGGWKKLGVPKGKLQLDHAGRAMVMPCTRGDFNPTGRVFDKPMKRLAMADNFSI